MAVTEIKLPKLALYYSTTFSTLSFCLSPSFLFRFAATSRIVGATCFSLQRLLEAFVIMKSVLDSYVSITRTEIFLRVKKQSSRYSLKCA